jgi:cytoskeletal protein RodZ
MAGRPDDVKVESVEAHRSRLRQAFLLGRVARRRDVDSGLKALVAAVVLAGVACAGCVGFAIVSNALEAQASSSPSAAASASPVPNEKAPTAAQTPKPAKPSPTPSGKRTPAKDASVSARVSPAPSEKGGR